GLACEDVWLTTSDGVRIHGWFVPAKNAATSTASPTILFLHGNAGNITARLEKLQIFNGLGFSTFIIEYRGYGKSEGHPSETGTYRDADAAYAWLTETKKILPDNIILYGESVGSGPALDIAARKKIGGLIVESEFTSI